MTAEFNIISFSSIPKYIQHINVIKTINIEYNKEEIKSKPETQNIQVFSDLFLDKVDIFIFDIDQLLDLFENMHIETVPQNINFILTKSLLDYEKLEKLEWTIPIIDDKSFTFLKTIVNKYPNISIKNVLVLKPLFIPEEIKLKDHTVIYGFGKAFELTTIKLT